MKHLNEFLNENKRYGDWSVTQQDENSIKLVNQDTFEELYVYPEKGNKYSTSWAGIRIIDSSLKKVMDKVLKLK